MDDANGEHKSKERQENPSGTIIIRWEREEGTPAPGEEDRILRGTVIGFPDEILGIFAGVDSLLEILREILREIMEQNSTRRPNWRGRDRWKRP